MLHATGTLTDKAKLSDALLDWRTKKEPTGLADNISVVISL